MEFSNIYLYNVNKALVRDDIGLIRAIYLFEQLTKKYDKILTFFLPFE